MKNQFLFFAFSFCLFSCSNTSTNPKADTWKLESQEVMMMDTIYSLDSIGNATSIFSIDTVSFPIRNNVQETWTFTLNDSLLISTTLVDGKIHNLKYKIENTTDGFFLKRNGENQFCKILKKDEEEMILEARGKIILKKQ